MEANTATHIVDHLFPTDTELEFVKELNVKLPIDFTESELLNVAKTFKKDQAPP